MLDSIIDDLKKVLRRLEEYKQGQERVQQEEDLLSPNDDGYAVRDATTRSRVERGMTGRRLFDGGKKRKTRKTRKRRYKK